MILEKTIEEILAQIEGDQLTDNFATHQEDYWLYLNSDSFKGLGEDELQSMFFISSVIYHSYVSHNKAEPEFDIEAFQDCEEENWSLRESAKDMDEAVDSFFDKYGEEDLLAFVEDVLTPEEESEETKLSREIILITSKSYIDHICKA